MIISLDKYKATSGGSGGSNTTETTIETGLVYKDGTVYNPNWEIQPADFFNGNKDRYITYRTQYDINWDYVNVAQPLKLTNHCIYSEKYMKQIWDNNNNEWRYIYNDNNENIYDNDLSIYTHNLYVRDNNTYEIVEPYILTYDNSGQSIWDNAQECDNIFPPFYNYNDSKFSDENVKKYFTKFYCTNDYYNLVDKYNNDTSITVGDQAISSVQLKIDILPYITTNMNSSNLNSLDDAGINIIGTGLTYYSSNYEILDDNKIYAKDLYFYDLPLNLEYVVPLVGGEYRKDGDIIYGKLSPYGQDSNIKNFINYRPDSNEVRLTFEGSYIGWKIIPATHPVEITSLFFNDKSKANCQSIDFGNCIYMAKTNVSDNGTTYEEINTNYVFGGCSKLKQILNLDTSKVMKMNDMFYGCSSLTSIPKLDTSNVTSMRGMLRDCSSLISIPKLNTSNVTNMYSMFYGCSSLTSIPQLDTSNVTSMGDMFAGCISLTSIPLLDASNVTDMEFIFANMPYNVTSLTDLGGFKNLSVSVTNGFISTLHGLTVESLMNIINNLATVSAESLTFGKVNLNKLTPEQIAVATTKGWTLTA